MAVGPNPPFGLVLSLGPSSPSTIPRPGDPCAQRQPTPNPPNPPSTPGRVNPPSCHFSYPPPPKTHATAPHSPAGLPTDTYVADELNGCTSPYPHLKTMGPNAHAANPSVKTIMTINTPDPNLFNEGDGRSAIDHWVLLDSMQQWPALPFTGGGSDLWSYTSCNPGFGNTPEWMVDYPPINERIQAGVLN